MKDEIKRKIKGYVYNEDDEKKILDYITNLQEETERQSKAQVILDDENAELQGKITELQEENERLKELYKRTCKHLFNIGNDELARYFQAQISECNVFTTQGKSDE